MTAPPALDAVVIGRNEGARLIACLESMRDDVRRMIYVDSGSEDGSVEAARALGAEVVELDPARPFTAARARNAGLARLDGTTDFVQLVDGDCALRRGWIAAASRYLRDNPQTAVVCGRRRERHPEASLYNRLCDAEWDTPIGPARACGGDALMRLGALRAVGGYRDDLIAGEEPELCVRLRQAGWVVYRLDHEMTWHDAAMTRFPQWWRRAWRAGHAFAEGAALHGAPPERHWVTETRRALIWGLVLPVAVLLGAVIWPGALVLLLIYPAQVLRLAARKRISRAGWEQALFSVLGKFAEAFGVVDYWQKRLRGQHGRIIEYK
ncbi:glycosyltransferase [Aestuariivita sp.]|jgi:glycosyltransferase involved in cell wall biosynthesis|uniref:glycosyltransferase n=1 Tax=Aestuariivita sp. TaxID=1872407 RepID=UPI002172C4A3|nr:glycosyltransferase [Aestuariivita sp.]MCE8009693.1 glycosyltransferase [Aestuariivita sp.]